MLTRLPAELFPLRLDADTSPLACGSHPLICLQRAAQARASALSKGIRKAKATAASQ